MKKSNLRKIIRESIKQLMTEQSLNSCNTGQPQPVWGYSQYGCCIQDWPNGGAYPNGWTYTFTNTVKNMDPQNQNPNQPCNFLNNKETQFAGQLAGGAGPVQTNIWGCKLNQIMALKASYFC